MLFQSDTNYGEFLNIFDELITNGKPIKCRITDKLTTCFGL